MSRSTSSAGFQPAFNDLLVGWKTVRIGDVVLKKVEQHIPSGPETILYIDIGSVDNSAKRITETKSIPAATAPSRARQKVATGDILVSMTRPNLNAVAVVPPDLDGATASTGFDVLRPSEAVLSDWIFLIVRSRHFVDAMTALVQGALYPAVRPADIRNYVIPLPPLAEQRRIVARLEALMARSRRARALLAEVPAQLAQSRQSFLAAAFRGDLTADWRTNHRSFETGSELLERLKIERRKNWEIIQLEKMRVRGKRHADDTWKSRYPSPIASLCSEPLPNNWGWTTLSELEDGKRKSAYGVLKPGEHDPHGVPILKSGQVRHGWVDLSEEYRISRELDAEFSKTRLLGGEVLINLVGASIGRSAIAPNETAGYNLSRAIGMIPVHAELAVYVQLVLSAPASQRSIKEKTGGSAQGVLNMEEVRSLSIPLPPLPEQREIVRRLQTAFARLDAAATAHAVAVAELDRLDQALLARAFSGGLVPPETVPETTPVAPAASVKAQTYLLRFIPALLRAAGHPVSLDDLSSVVALRFLPAADLLPVVERIGGAAARTHFAHSTVAYEDGAFLAAMRVLRRTDAIAVSTSRRGVQHLSLGAKPPPSTPEIDADARHLVPLLSRVPAKIIAPVLRRLQSTEVREALLATP